MGRSPIELKRSSPATGPAGNGPSASAARMGGGTVNGVEASSPGRAGVSKRQQAQVSAPVAVAPPSQQLAHSDRWGPLA
jgi:hypothetical protein